MEEYAAVLAQALNQVACSCLPSTGTPLPCVQLSDLEFPPDPNWGDFAFPCFQWAHLWKKSGAPRSPQTVALEVVAALQKRGLLPTGLEAVAQAGYVNFTLQWGTLLRALLQNQEASSPLPTASPLKTWVFDYSSPNIAKPLNIYHLRPTVLGAALARMAQKRGYRVISINHLGDWGKQYGMLALALTRQNLSLDTPLSLEELVQLYIQIHREADQDPSLHDQARQAFLELEQKTNPMLTAFWKKCVAISWAAFEKSYQRLGVEFDYVWGESFYQEQLAPLLESLKAKGLLEESQGAQVVFVKSREGKDLPPCLLQKQDGASIYATRDLAAALYRYEQFQFDRMTYIVGAEQKLHFEQVFGVLRRLGLAWEAGCEHLSFGLYRFRDAKMSTRKGNFLTLEEVFDQVKEQVSQVLEKRERHAISEEEKKIVCEEIALGALLFQDLHTDPVKDVDFDLQKITSFEGETGPYLQYAHTRCASLLEKAKKAGIPLLDTLVTNGLTLDHPEERQLLRFLARFPLEIERGLQLRKPSVLAHFLVEVAQRFHRFYRECPILGADNSSLREERLLLVSLTQSTLAEGLRLLGIPRPQKM